MAKERPATKLCKHCKTEIPYEAKVCPNCRKRVKGGKVKWIVLPIVVVIIALVLFSGGSKYDDGSGYNTENLISEEQYDALFSNVSAHVGQSVDLYGKIFNILDANDGTVFQMYTDEDSSRFVVVYDASNTAVKEEDYVLVKGVVTDAYEGENLMGGSVTCPLISAHEITASSYIEAFSPSIKTINPLEAKWSKDGLSLQVDQVEFAENETRVYVTQQNDGKEPAELYLHSAVAVQGEKQYELSYNYEAEYDDVQDELQPGITDSGVLVYPAMKQDAFRLVFSGSAKDDYNDQTISVAFEEKTE